jgi:hypothetical protein
MSPTCPDAVLMPERIRLTALDAALRAPSEITTIGSCSDWPCGRPGQLRQMLDVKGARGDAHGRKPMAGHQRRLTAVAAEQLDHAEALVGSYGFEGR